ncbi:unnamed protein product [Closterium sp. Yama58-4]|nr:unnamed protein product [Closterium sp. Yama58-4]
MRRRQCPWTWAFSQIRGPPEQLTYHVCLPPDAFTIVYDDPEDDLLYDDAKKDVDLPELDPDMHADPEHRWDIGTMTVKEALASWKGKAVKAAMDEEIRSLIGMGTWELVERLRRVYGADYGETCAPVSSYITLRIFLSIVAVLDLNLMQLDMKNAFLQSKLDKSPLLWYRALDVVLMRAGWKKSQVDEALYFKVGDDGVACWVLVYVDDLLAASSSTAMLKELKELLEAAFKLREISRVVKYLGLEITPISLDAYAELTFDNEKAQEREEEEYRQKVGSLQFAATTTRPDIAFACSKLGSGLTVRSDQHWREVDRCLAYLANTRDTALEFGGGPETLELVGYVDADDAGDKQNRTSTGGYMFVYGGAAVSWSSARH